MTANIESRRAGHRGVVLRTDGEGKQLVDLAATFGAQYRVFQEADGWLPEDRPWLLEIRGRFGLVHPRGGEILTAVIDAERHPLQAAKLRKLPGAIRIRGGAELRVDFHVADADAVFEIIKPYRRRRRLSEAERNRLGEIGAPTRFEKGVRRGVEVPAEGANTRETVSGRGEGPIEAEPRPVDPQPEA